MLEPSACVKLMMANACCKQTYSTTGLANSAQNQSVHNVEIDTAEETNSRVQSWNRTICPNQIYSSLEFWVVTVVACWVWDNDKFLRTKVHGFQEELCHRVA